MGLGAGLLFSSALAISFVCSIASAAELQLAPNEMPIHVGGSLADGANVPLVSVTICEPGTNNCRTVDRIQLDTASVGLRLFTSLTNRLNLPAVTDPNRHELFECTSFGGGDSYWGPIRRADIKLGGEVATNIRVQTWQDPPSDVNCAIERDKPEAGEINGILGVSFAQDDCTDVGTDKDCGASAAFRYYTCDGAHCEPLNDATSLAVSNPMSGFKKDNNGYVIDFPLVVSPQKTITGTMTFGLNTEGNNQLGPSSTREIPLSASGWFNLRYDGHIFLSRFDTGSDSYYLPDEFDLPMCTYFCPPHITTMHLNVDTGHAFTPFDIQIADPGDATNDDDIQVIPGLANLLGGSPFIIGMPFFYGKKIYFGLAQGGNRFGFVAF